MSALPALRSVTRSAAAVPGPARPRIAEIDAVSRPARTFTGDFYYTHRAADRLWLAHGDVAGKGLPAAIVMAMIQEELEQRIASCAEAACNPATTMRRLHEFLLPLMPQNRFATGVIAHLHGDGTLTLANGGHCPPLIVRNDGTIEELASTGPLLGILPRAAWRAHVTRLEPGERLVLYSDGVTEATLGEEELGVDGLKRILSSVTDTRGILEALRERCVTDDMTLVVVRRV